MKDHQNKMEFKIAVTNPMESEFSLKKEDSDFSNNQIVLNAVIGTLVKYGPSGRIEPYLAESWTVTSDNKTWIFKLRKGLFTESNQEINANLFIETLTNNLKSYSNRGSVIIFDHLMGWNDFLSGKSDCPIGLSVIDNSIKFEFESSPDSFLEILRMPYFGLWLESGKIISTGPYSIKKFLSNEIVLSLRDEWFTTSKDSTKEVIISFTDLKSFNLKTSKSSITRLPFYVETDSHIESGYWIKSPPTILENFTLSPSKSNFFNNKHNRNIFNARIMSHYPHKIKADFFYPSARSTINKSINSDVYENVSEASTLTFALERSTYSAQELNNLNEIITFALAGTNINFKIIERDLKDKEWFKKTDSNDFFDARISYVDIGASPLYTSIKMMFCTKLGINYPDPSGRICELVSEGIASSKGIDESFIKQFNQIIYDDAVVIPIQHHSYKWFVTNDIDPKSLPPTTLYPQFELIRTR